MIHIRRNTEADVGPLVLLMTEAFSAQYKKKFTEDMGIRINADRIEGFKKAAAPHTHSIWLLAEDEQGQLVGGVRLLSPPLADVWIHGAAEAKGLVIAPTLQGQGLGRTLMNALKKEALLLGYQQICCRVRKEATDLRRYYETYGLLHDPQGDQTLPTVNLTGYVYNLEQSSQGFD